MYCNNCGKETSDAASFCPYCGAKKTTGIPEMQRETVRPVQKVSNGNIDEVLPVYKRKNKMAFLVAFIPLICIVVCRVIVIGYIFYRFVTIQPRDSYSNLKYAVLDEILENNEGVYNE